MTKFIGIKELQMNTKRIREAVSKGIHFIVIYRSKPIFEIKPLAQGADFVRDLKNTGLYNQAFIDRMEEAEKNLKNGKVKVYSVEKFLKSLA